MKEFQNDKVYCLHNTGIDFQTIFFSPRNKKYFQQKITKFIAPFADVKHVSLYFNQFFIVIKTKKDVDLTLFRKNIGIMIGSYSRGVNIEQDRMGSLFRKGTKAYIQFSDLPTYAREKFEALRKFLDPSRVVDFLKSTKTFFTALDNYLLGKNQQHLLLRLHEVLAHPKGKLSKMYLEIAKKYDPEIDRARI